MAESSSQAVLIAKMREGEAAEPDVFAAADAVLDAGCGETGQA
jgi:hypothetical protein